MGQRVACVPGNAFSQYAIADAAMCLPLGDHSSETGASSFVNPMTALGFVENAKMDGQKAILHTVGASNLGQMLNRICLEDGMELVNIVRKDEQVELLKSQGATHIVNSSDDDFMDQLKNAIDDTDAFYGFDPIGGGKMVDTCFKAMEQVAVGKMTEYSRYGSNQQKRMFIYGRLDFAPTDAEPGLWFRLDPVGLAADTVPRQCGHGNRHADAGARPRQPDDDLCQQLQGKGRSGRHADQGRHPRLQADENRREISRNAELMILGRARIGGRATNLTFRRTPSASPQDRSPRPPAIAAGVSAPFAG